MAEILALESIRAGYGASVVLDGVSLRVEQGECVAILGRNGVGKSTLLATIMGLTRLHHGTIRWRGEAIESRPAHARARGGLGWVPQERLMWRSLTVDEHLACVARAGPWSIERVRALFPALARRGDHRGAELSGGEQQMVAIARALVTNPRLLLLDEPMEGLAPLVVGELCALLRRLVDAGDLAILVVEQRVELALSLARRGIVMERGRVVREGSSEELLADRDALARLLAVS